MKVKLFRKYILNKVFRRKRALHYVSNLLSNGPKKTIYIYKEKLIYRDEMLISWQSSEGTQILCIILTFL